MQAIVSDIIVSQAAQTGQLQISQNLNNNSSNQVSFLDLVNSQRPDEGNLQSRLNNNDKVEQPPKAYEEQKAAPEAQDKKSEDVSQTEKQPVDNTEQETDAQKTGKKADETVKDKLSKADAADSAKKTVQSDNEKNLKLAGETDAQAAQKNAVENAKKKSGLEKTAADKAQIEKNGLKNSELLTEEADEQVSGDVTELQNQYAQLAQLYDESKNAKANIKSEDAADLQTELKIDSKAAEIQTQEKNLLSKITVRDERTVKPELEESVVEKANSNSKSDKLQLKNTVQPVQIEMNGNNSATVTMDLAQTNLAEPGSNVQTFQTMLTNQLEAAAPEFVKTGTILLQDNNKGTINLVLHPDDLGNVKIHLSMDGKTISAHITVNTKEALEVFKDNAQTLREAFAKNGFETSNFDVSYNGSSNNQNQNFEGRYDGTEYWARNAYNDSLGGEKDGHIQEAYEYLTNSEYSINIVA